MKKYRIVPFGLVLSLLVVLMVVAMQQPAVTAQGENLLNNGSFEGAYSSFIPQTDAQKEACPVGECTTAQMPAGWLPWWVNQTDTDEPWQNRMPEYKPVCPFQPCPFPERLYEGTQALQYFTFHSTHTAGMWQRVNVPAFSNLKFSVWGQAWSSASDATYSDFPTQVNMRIGIDPTGGTNPFSASIVWSGFAEPLDAYSLFEVEATAQGESVTVWMWSQPLEARKHNDIYWDGATLVRTGQGVAAAPVASSGGNSGGGQVAAAPARPLGPTPTPNAEGVIEVVVQPGDTLWSVAARAGLSLDELLEINNIGRDDFINSGDVLILGFGDATEGGGGGGGESGEPATTEDEGGGETADADVASDEVEAAADGVEPAAEESAVEELAEEAPVAVAADGAPAEEEMASGGVICLRAFDDPNEDGIFGAGESLRTNVAFTISNGQAVVSNYVTNGSEPFCIEGLEPGNYRVSRSLVAKEQPTNAADWAISVSNGSRIDIDFGSKIDESAPEPAAEVAAISDTSVADTTASDAADTTAAVDGSAADSGTNWVTWVVAAIVGLAVLLLIGVGLVVLSARRVN